MFFLILKVAQRVEGTSFHARTFEPSATCFHSTGISATEKLNFLATARTSKSNAHPVSATLVEILFQATALNALAPHCVSE